jgi:hypothetical protein
MPTKAAYALKLPHSIKNAAQRLAAVDGVSLNQFIAVAVAEKIGALESAEVFLKQSRNSETIRHEISAAPCAAICGERVGLLTDN